MEGRPSSAASGGRTRWCSGLYRFERWLGGRQIEWLNRLPFAVPGLWRTVRSHHRARVDLNLPAIEAEIAVKALQRRGWQHVATGVAEDEDGGPALTRLVFTVWSLPVRTARAAGWPAS